MPIQDTLSKQRDQVAHDPEVLALLGNYEAAAAAHRGTPEYQTGYDAGARDAETMMQPIHTNGHTESFYLTARATYEEAIHNFAPTAWQLGYGEGFDAKVLELRPQPAQEGGGE